MKEYIPFRSKPLSCASSQTCWNRLVPVAFFFEGIEGTEAEGDAGVMPADLMGDKEALDLVRSYYAIPENQRRRLFDLARVLSDVA